MGHTSLPEFRSKQKRHMKDYDPDFSHTVAYRRKAARMALIGYAFTYGLALAIAVTVAAIVYKNF